MVINALDNGFNHHMLTMTFSQNITNRVTLISLRWEINIKFEKCHFDKPRDCGCAGQGLRPIIMLTQQSNITYQSDATVAIEMIFHMHI